MNLSIFRRRAEDAATIARLTEALAESKTQCDARDDRIAMLERSLADTDGLMTQAERLVSARREARLRGRDAGGRFAS